MTKIAIITDSDASLPDELATRYHIKRVPIGINFGTDTFEDGVDIDDQKVFERIDREKQLPTTSAPSAGQFSEAYRAAFNAGYETVVCICVSSEVSATYNSALSAAEMFPERDIAVIDSRNLSMGEGFMVIAAAEAAERGEPKDKVIAEALNVGKRSQYYAALSTLKYLAMSGRVGHLAAGMANILNIQPILTIRDGKLDMLEKIRTRKKALSRLIELTKAGIGDQAIERMAIIHVNVLEEASLFEERLRAEVDCPQDILMCKLGAGLSVHAGAGLIGVSFILKD